MTKEMMINGKQYTIIEITAVALNAGDTEAQDALLVITEDERGEKEEAVVFGFEMPEYLSDMINMFDEPAAWDTDRETLDTVRVK